SARGPSPPLRPASPTVTGTPPKHVYRWDLDKTYLATEFDTMRDLVRSAFEKAEAKRSVPGAAALLRELRKHQDARICFISGSPLTDGALRALRPAPGAHLQLFPGRAGPPRGRPPRDRRRAADHPRDGRQVRVLARRPAELAAGPPPSRTPASRDPRRPGHPP